LVLAPKQHYANCLEIDEQVQTEMRNFQKSLVAYYQEVFKMQAVFIETSIESETGHASIDCVGVPESEEMVDLELYFKKSLQDDDAEWATHKALIDTKARKGQIWKCLPESGQFNYVHIDFNGVGGFAHIIEDARRFGPLKALEVLGGALGLDFVNLTIPLRKEKAEGHARRVRALFEKYDWTGYKK